MLTFRRGAALKKVARRATSGSLNKLFRASETRQNCRATRSSFANAFPVSWYLCASPTRAVLIYRYPRRFTSGSINESFRASETRQTAASAPVSDARGINYRYPRRFTSGYLLRAAPRPRRFVVLRYVFQTRNV